MKDDSRSADLFEIEDKHTDIHKALENWARWVQVRAPSWVSLMFRQAQSNSRQWHQPDVREACDPLAAMEVEKAVYKLPESHRSAVRWYYVFKGCPMRKARSLGVNQVGLKKLARDARQMLVNRGVDKSQNTPL